MKICFISEAKSIHTQRWASSLADIGCDIHLISSSKANIPNVKIYQLPIYSQNPYKQIINHIRIGRLIKKIKPDIFHLFGLFSVYSLGTMFLIRKLKNLVISVWGSDVVPGENKESHKNKIIKKYLLNQGVCIVAISKYLANQTKSYLKHPRDIEIISWGVNLDIFKPAAPKRNSKVVTLGFAKRLHHLSGPDVLIKGFKYALDHSEKKLLLKIAGDGPMKLNLEREAKNLGINNFIEWMGWLPDHESLVKFYHSIDVFLMPSRRESFGVSAVEASATGLPVIASKFGGIPEIVINGKSGLLISSEDAEGLGKAIVLLADNKKLRSNMGVAGRKFIKETYDWNESLKQMIEVYKKINNNVEL